MDETRDVSDGPDDREPAGWRPYGWAPDGRSARRAPRGVGIASLARRLMAMERARAGRRKLPALLGALFPRLGSSAREGIGNG